VTVTTPERLGDSEQQVGASTVRGRQWRRGLAVVVAALGFLLPYVVTAPYYRHLLVNAAILGVFGMSVAFLIRRLGMVSLGHALYFGGAAYAVGGLVQHRDMAVIPAVLAGLGLVVLLAVVVGSLVVRVRGIAFTMLTLAFGQFAFTLAGLTQLRPLTGGDDGFGVRFTGTVLGLTFRQLASPANMWMLCWTVVVLSLAGLGLLSRSPFGQTLDAIRENEERVKFNGSNTYVPVLAAYVVSALLAGVAGVLFVLYNSFISLDVLAWTTSGNALIVSFIGGCWTATGPLWGALIYTLGNAWLVAGGRTEWQLYVGIAVITVLVFAKSGVVGTVERLIARYLGPARRPRGGAKG